MSPVQAPSSVLTGVLWYSMGQNWSLCYQKVHANWFCVICRHLCIKPRTFDQDKKIHLCKPQVCVMRVRANVVLLYFLINVNNKNVQQWTCGHFVTKQPATDQKDVRCGLRWKKVAHLGSGNQSYLITVCRKNWIYMSQCYQNSTRHVHRHDILCTSNVHRRFDPVHSPSCNVAWPDQQTMDSICGSKPTQSFNDKHQNMLKLPDLHPQTRQLSDSARRHDGKCNSFITSETLLQR